MRTGSAQSLDDNYAVPAQEAGSRWYAPAAVGLAELLFLARLGVRELWASEDRWAAVVRKPLLSYWFILPATYLTGGLNEAAMRLPSAIFGLAGVVLIIVVARRLYDRTTAALAGLILATSISDVCN